MALFQYHIQLNRSNFYSQDMKYQERYLHLFSHLSCSHLTSHFIIMGSIVFSLIFVVLHILFVSKDNFSVVDGKILLACEMLFIEMVKSRGQSIDP